MTRDGWVIRNTSDGTFLASKHNVRSSWVPFERARLFTRKSDAEQALARLHTKTTEVEHVIIWYPNGQEE